MVRELRRLLIDPARLAVPELTLDPQENRYLRRVLRFGAGDRFAVTDGAGRLWTAVLLEGAAARLEQPAAAPLEVAPPPAPPLELAVAIPRRDFDVLLRMVCELGIDRIQPLVAERGTGHGEGRGARWETIVREACEQCERLWLPELAGPAAAAPWLAQPRAGLGLLATTRREGLPLITARLEAMALPSAAVVSEGVALAIGPEGGWTPQEEMAAAAAGWLGVSLGPHILRTSTAAVVGAALLAQWRANRPAGSGQVG